MRNKPVDEGKRLLLTRRQNIEIIESERRRCRRRHQRGFVLA